MRILIAEDDETTSLLLSRIVEKLGHSIITATDGAEAFGILKKGEIYLLITDWMMPKMNGIELCRRIREAQFDHYIYIILLTAKDTTDELIEGMDAGADDFAIKPVDINELRARIRAGERIIQLERDLAEQIKKQKETNEELNDAYSVIKKDLEAAARIQRSLLPKPDSISGRIRFSWTFLPSTFVAGDTLNYFRLDEENIGFYLLDVAGHGIPAALLSVTLSRTLSDQDLRNNPLKRITSDPPYYEILPPAAVVSDLNIRFQSDEDIIQYFTMIYGIIDIKSGQTRITQAGHPSPIFLTQNDDPVPIGGGGFPVGMLPDLTYDEHEFQLTQGDRLFLYSDGVTECTSGQSGTEMFSEERLIKLLKSGKDLPLDKMMESIEKNLRLWKGDEKFEDDVTFLTLEII